MGQAAKKKPTELNKTERFEGKLGYHEKKKVDGHGWANRDSSLQKVDVKGRNVFSQLWPTLRAGSNTVW